MTIDDVWNSAGNTPTPAARESLLAETRAELRRAQRRRVAFVGATAVSLLAVSGLTVYAWVTKGGAVAGAAPMTALLLAQWAAFALFVKDLLYARRGMRAELSIRDSLTRLRQEAETQRRRQTTILALYAVAVPLVAVAILQLRDAGKMAPREALSAAIAFGVVIAVGTTVLLLRRYLSLRPRQRRLDALLQQYRHE